MRIIVTLEHSGNARWNEHILNELETARDEEEGITIRVGGGSFELDVVEVEEVPA